jgi:hypothetical protein
VRNAERRSDDRKMAGVSPFSDDHTSKPSVSTDMESTESGKVFDTASPSDPGNNYILHEHTCKSSFGKFWARTNDQPDEDEEEEITTPNNEEFIAAAARAGFQLEDLIQAENEIAAVEKVSLSSPSSTDFRCPLSCKIIDAMV